MNHYASNTYRYNTNGCRVTPYGIYERKADINETYCIRPAKEGTKKAFKVVLNYRHQSKGGGRTVIEYFMRDSLEEVERCVKNMKLTLLAPIEEVDKRLIQEEITA
jgi:hypothetical protein